MNISALVEQQLANVPGLPAATRNALAAQLTDALSAVQGVDLTAVNLADLISQQLAPLLAAQSGAAASPAPAPARAAELPPVPDPSPKAAARPGQKRGWQPAAHAAGSHQTAARKGQQRSSQHTVGAGQARHRGMPHAQAHDRLPPHHRPHAIIEEELTDDDGGLLSTTDEGDDTSEGNLCSTTDSSGSREPAWTDKLRSVQLASGAKQRQTGRSRSRSASQGRGQAAGSDAAGAPRAAIHRLSRDALQAEASALCDDHLYESWPGCLVAFSLRTSELHSHALTHRAHIAAPAR